jgi:CBS-domain-containing membrane protein
VKEAARLLIQHSISALPVVDASGKLVGIVSEADLLAMETRPDPRTQAMPIPPTAGSSPRLVSDVMTRRVVTILTDSEVSQAARLMIEAEVKRLPVMDGDQLVGIVSRRDLVKVIARRDEDVQAELARRLSDVGLELTDGAVRVNEGIASIALRDSDPSRRLAESVALTVAGVMEVRFTS